MTDPTIDLDKILSAAVDRGASDVHLKAGRPPIVRFDGELRAAARLLRRWALSSWRLS